MAKKIHHLLNLLKVILKSSMMEKPCQVKVISSRGLEFSAGNIEAVSEEASD